MHAVLETADYFAVHLLSDEQSGLCSHFAVPDQRGDDQLQAVAHRSGKHGTPILKAAPAVLFCRWHEAFGAGDHVIVVGRVTQLEERKEAPPILYYDRDYRSVSTPSPAECR